MNDSAKRPGRTVRRSLVAPVRSSLLIHPVVLYSAVWLLGLALVWSGWLAFMTGVKRQFLFLVVGNICIAIVAYAIARYATVISTRRRRRIVAPAGALRTFSTVLLGVWLSGSILNIIASGGLPIIWALQGQAERSYTDFGIPTFTGLISACGLFASLGFFLLFRRGSTKGAIWPILLVLAFQFAILSRGGAVWMMLQMVGIYLQTGRVGLRRLVSGGLLLLTLVIGFGVMGDLRAAGRAQQFLGDLTTPQGEAIFTRLPSGLWWTYLYASVGPVNLNAALDRHKPSGVPHWSVVNLFPTVLRSRIYTEEVYEARYPLEMANRSFNVFTMYGGYFADFGLLGCLAITFVLHLVAGHYFVKARMGDTASVIAYSVCFQVIVLSLFADSLTSWVTLFQFVLAMILRRYERGAIRSAAERHPQPGALEGRVQEVTTRDGGSSRLPGSGLRILPTKRISR